MLSIRWTLVKLQVLKMRNKTVTFLFLLKMFNLEACYSVSLLKGPTEPIMYVTIVLSEHIIQYSRYCTDIKIKLKYRRHSLLDKIHCKFTKLCGFYFAGDCCRE